MFAGISIIINDLLAYKLLALKKQQLFSSLLSWNTEASTQTRISFPVGLFQNLTKYLGLTKSRIFWQL